MKQLELRKGKGWAYSHAAHGQVQTSKWWSSFCCSHRLPQSPRQSQEAQRSLAKAL